jgi:hypothetical protein
MRGEETVDAPAFHPQRMESFAGASCRLRRQMRH